jgi:hypothetical protein
MTIDEMIEYIERSDIKLDIEKQIIAALRAGQAMRSCYILPGHPECPEGMIAAWDYEQACVAWDAATNSEAE